MKKEITFEEFLPVFTGAFGKDLDYQRRKEFIQVPEKMAAIKSLFLYFTGNKRFEESSGHSLHKGIYLLGPIGVGKTITMRAFEYLRRAFHEATNAPYLDKGMITVVPSISLVTNYNLNGEESLRSIVNIPGLCIDDLGNEEIGHHFGNKRDVVSQIIQMRYNTGALTHATSNIKPTDLRQKYDERVIDRMREMFNVVKFDLNGKSMRR